MKAHRLRAFFLQICGILTVIFCCTYSNQVLGIPKDDFQKRIAQNEYEFLKIIDYSRYDVDQLASLYPGSRYYFAHIYRTLNMKSITDELLRTEWVRGKEPWRYKVGLQILAELSDEKNYIDLEKIASDGLFFYGLDHQYLYYYLEAVYWLRKYDLLFNNLNEYRSLITFEQSYSVRNKRLLNSEALLWEAVGRYRTRQNYNQQLFEDLFYNFSAANYHSRAYNYIIDEPDLLNQFSDWQVDFFKAKHFVNNKSYQRAAQLFESVLPDIPAQLYATVLTPRTIRDIGLAYYYGGFSKTGSKRFLKIIAELDGLQHVAALEWRGRLLLRAGKQGEAQAVFIQAFEANPNDTTLRLAFETAFDRSFSEGIRLMQQYAPRIRNRYYYRILFDYQTSAAVRLRRWDVIWKLRDIAMRYGAPYDRARLAVVSAEGVRTGATTTPRGVTKQHLRDELEYARTQTQSAYYAHVAAFMLGKSSVRTFQVSAERIVARTPFSKTECTRLIDGYFKFHLNRRGYRQFRECAHYYDTDALMARARALHRDKVFNYAIRILDIARRRNDFLITEQTARILYPRAFKEYIEPIAKKNNISRHFFYSTIREESYFTTEVSSHAGAIGLGQFIPSTARAVAGRMNLPTPDLTDPEQNLSLSGFHLQELLQQGEDKQIFALSAYNAGIRRARRWLNTRREYSDLLLHEGISIFETRHYIRKILVTNIQYATLYDTIPQRDIIKRYYTDLKIF